MGIRKPRRHIRFQPQAQAQLRVEGGVSINCSIRDISMSGAYLLKQESPSREVVIEPGTRVRIRVEDPQSGARHTLNAEVVRCEPDGGPGLAVRFLLTEEHVDPVVDYVRAAGQHVGAPPEALKTPHLHFSERQTWRFSERQTWRFSERQTWRSALRITKAVVQVSVLACSSAFAYIGVTWFDNTTF
jgi:hypothetical protein